MIPPRLVAAAQAGLEQADAEILPGYDPAAHDGSQADAVRRLAADIDGFRERHGLARVVVIDVSSTEAIPEDRPEFHDPALLAQLPRRPRRRPASGERDLRPRRDRVGQRVRVLHAVGGPEPAGDPCPLAR